MLCHTKAFIIHFITLQWAQTDVVVRWKQEHQKEAQKREKKETKPGKMHTPYLNIDQTEAQLLHFKILKFLNIKGSVNSLE